MFNMNIFGISMPILLLIRVAIYIVGVYCAFLLIKLIRKATEALELYIANMSRLNDEDAKFNKYENH